MSEIRALTGLRGVAALMIAAYHFTGLGLGAPDILAPLLRHGYLAVDLFFVLSGYLMARTYGPLFAGGVGAYGWFLGRRISRIYPMYAVAILATFCLARLQLWPPGAHGADGVGKLAIDLAMLQCLGSGPNLLPVAWSLSTEWVAYLLFPLIAIWGLHRGRAAAMLLAALALCGTAVLLTLPDATVHMYARHMRRAWFDFSDTTTPWPLLRCLAGFSIGLLSWRATRGWNPPARTRAWFAFASLVACLGLAWTQQLDLFAVPAFACLVAALGLQDRQARPARWLGSAPVHAIGTISYSLYLTHLMVWQAMQHVPPGLPRPLLAFLPALLVASVGYWAVERPGRRWLRHLLPEGQSALAEIAAPPPTEMLASAPPPLVG